MDDKRNAKMKNIIALILTCLSIHVESSQTNYHYDINGSLLIKPGQSFSLYDFATQRKYVLDSTHTIISAFDKVGKLIWSTNPYKDSHLQEYRTKSPYIRYMAFTTEKISPHLTTRCGFRLSIQEKYSRYYATSIRVIVISYNNSQFGVIDLESGKFCFYGQD